MTAPLPVPPRPTVVEQLRLSRPRGGLARSLLIAFLPLVVGPLVTLAIIVYFQSQADLTRQIAAQFSSLAETKESQLQQWETAQTADIRGFVREATVLDKARILVNSQSTPAEHDTARSAITGYLEDYLNGDNNTSYKGFAVLRPDTGEILLATANYQRLVGQKMILDESNLRSAAQSALVTAPRYDPRVDADGIYVVAAGPIHDPSLGNYAVLAGVLIPARIQGIIAPGPGLGRTGQVYAVTSDGYQFGNTFSAQTVRPDNPVLRRALVDHETGFGTYQDSSGKWLVASYRWLPRYQMALIIEEDENEAYLDITRTGQLFGGVTALAVVVAVAGVLFFTRRITQPLEQLTDGVTRMAGGNLNVTVAIDQNNELGLLSKAFNSMARQLKELLSNLEERVTKRTAQLAAINVIAATVSSNVNIDQALADSVNLVRDRLGYYHVSVFLLDKSGNTALLRESTGEAGRRLKERGHHIEPSSGSPVGRALASRQPQIAREVEADAVRYNTSLLPHSRSEVALPLIVGDSLLGALDVHAAKPDAFDAEAIAVLQSVANQIAIALNNARLLQETHDRFNEISALNRQYLADAWTGYVDRQPDAAWLQMENGKVQRASSAEGAAPPVRVSAPYLDDNGQSMVVPISLREQIIGELMLSAPTVAGRWTEDDLALAEAVITQVAQALENARLLEQTQAALGDARRLANRERRIAEVSDRITQATSIQRILQVAAEELRRATGSSRASIRILPPASEAE